MLRKIGLVLLLMFSTIGFMTEAKEIPLEHFSKMPMVETPIISPDGKNIAVILNQGEFTQIAIVKFDNPSDMSIILQLGAEKYRIDSFAWANNERVLISVSQPYMVYNKWRRTSHLYSANLDGSDVKELRKKSRKQSAAQFWLSSPRLLSTLPEDPDHILVVQSDERDDHYTSVFKVNIKSGSFEKYLPNTNRIRTWVPNRKGEILLAVGMDKDYRKSIDYIYTRQTVKDDWKLIKTLEAFKDETFEIQLYEAATQSMIVISDHQTEDDTTPRRSRLWRYDIKSGQYTELLGAAPGSLDVTDVISRRVGDHVEVIGYNYNDGFERYVYFDKNSDKMARQIRPLFAKKGLEAFLYDWDLAKKRFMILTLSDSKPVNFYTFDSTKGALKAWYGAYPELAKAQLSKVERFEFKARDGMELHGYLTLPNGVEDPPVILHPHGGPYGVADSKYFDSYVQMFASRGYAVVQVNFRGSGNNGNDLHTKGYGQWGKKMQTDLLDALDWVEKSGKANTNKACVVGGSYGGYAALTAGYQTPERFKCLVSIAGVSDMNNLVKNFRKRGERAYINNAIKGENIDLDALSPINFADKFKAPVLLIHGKVDMRVGYRQSENMYNALKSAGKKVEYELFEYGTHHLDEAAIRTRSMALIEKFLKKHL